MLRRPAERDEHGGRAGLVHGVPYVFVLTPLINGLGHWRGAQNFANTAYDWRASALRSALAPDKVTEPRDAAADA